MAPEANQGEDLPPQQAGGSSSPSGKWGKYSVWGRLLVGPLLAGIVVFFLAFPQAYKQLSELEDELKKAREDSGKSIDFFFDQNNKFRTQMQTNFAELEEMYGEIRRRQTNDFNNREEVLKLQSRVYESTLRLHDAFEAELKLFEKFSFYAFGSDVHVINPWRWKLDAFSVGNVHLDTLFAMEGVDEQLRQLATDDSHKVTVARLSFTEPYLFSGINIKLNLLKQADSDFERQTLSIQAEECLNRYYKNFVASDNFTNPVFLDSLRSLEPSAAIRCKDTKVYAHDRWTCYYYYLMAKFLERQGKHNEALAFLKRARAVDPARAAVELTQFTYYSVDYMEIQIREALIREYSSSRDEAISKQNLEELQKRFEELITFFKNTPDRKKDIAYLSVILARVEWSAYNEKKLLNNWREIAPLFTEFKKNYGDLPATERVSLRFASDHLETHKRTLQTIYLGYSEKYTNVMQDAEGDYTKYQSEILTHLCNACEQAQTNQNFDAGLPEIKKAQDLISKFNQQKDGYAAGISLRLGADIEEIKRKKSFGCFEQRKKDYNLAATLIADPVDSLSQ
jgi:hypothetical protein